MAAVTRSTADDESLASEGHREHASQHKVGGEAAISDAKIAALRAVQAAKEAEPRKSLPPPDEGTVVEEAEAADAEVASAAEMAAKPTSRWRYTPFNGLCCDIREDPSRDAKRSEQEVQPGLVFEVAEELRGEAEAGKDAGVLFLRLADGRGWLFDHVPGDEGGLMCVRHVGEGDPARPRAVSSDAFRRSSSMPETRKVPLKLDPNDHKRWLCCLPDRSHASQTSVGSTDFSSKGGLLSIFRSEHRSTSALEEIAADDMSSTISTLMPKPERQGAEPVGPGSFSVVRFLGRGATGAVFQVSDKKTHRLYAMKVLQKAEMSKDLMQYAIAERNVLKDNNHPYVVSLHCAFQTPSHLVLAIQFGPRGTLQQLLVRERRLELATSRLYEAEVLLGVCHLHERQVVFRDLKPENIVLDEKGHCLLTDFGSSKLGVSGIQDASTFCGSPHFVAPEILAMKKHGPTVDIYGLGVLLFTMLTGLPPFYHPDMDILYANIRSAPLRCPAYVPEDASSFISQTMSRNPAKRPGSKRTADLQGHAFFSPFASSWESMLQREVDLPERPSQAAVEFWMKASDKKYSPHGAPPASVEDVVGRSRTWSSSKTVGGWDVPPAVTPEF